MGRKGLIGAVIVAGAIAAVVAFGDKVTSLLKQPSTRSTAVARNISTLEALRNSLNDNKIYLTTVSKDLEEADKGNKTFLLEVNTSLTKEIARLAKLFDGVSKEERVALQKDYGAVQKALAGLREQLRQALVSAGVSVD